MTITTAPAPLSFDGDDTTVNFPISWVYFAKADVVATLRSAADIETTQVLDSQYTLTAAGVSSGGTLTMITAPATGETLVISPEPANTQDSELPLGGAFPSTTVEDELDQAAIRDAKLESFFDRALKVPRTDTQTGDSLELPIESDRADNFLAFDSTGKPIAAKGTSANLKAVSVFVDTLLDDANAITFLQTLLIHKSGADIASAGTINLDTATGDFVDVTGTTSVTAITLGDGVVRTVRFTASLTLTDGASLVLPGSANIQTAAGDMAIFRGDASSVVRLVQYLRLQRHGADVSSAATIDIDAATGDLIDVTGTVTITAVTLAEGREATVRFTGVLTLTNGASLVLPGSANIATAAGDFAIFRGYASSVVRCVAYQRAASEPPGAELKTSVTASGTTVDFTSVPSWVRKITLMFFDLSTDGTSPLRVQLGDSGGVETSGYQGGGGAADVSAVTETTFSSGFDFPAAQVAAGAYSGYIDLILVDTLDWMCKGMVAREDSAQVQFLVGQKTLSATLDRIRLTAVNGTDSFDAGTVNIRYER